jgi:ribonuclease VapC
LALLNNEPGAARVDELLHLAGDGSIQVYMSLINLGEVLYIVERRLGKERMRSMMAYLDATPLKWVEADRKRVLASAHIKAMYPLAYADVFCVSLACELSATIITSDPEFKPLSELVVIEWLPEKIP